MTHLVRMALRNLWRNKRRSALAFSSVALSVLLCTFLLGFLGGYMSSLVKNYTQSETGHIRITTKEFQDRAELMPVDTMLADPRGIEARIAGEPELRGQVQLVTERIRFGVLLEHEGRNKSAVALAGDPRTEENLLYLQRAIEPGGRYIGGPGEAIVGASLAADLRLAVGDRLKVVSEASDGSLQLKKFAIVGVFRTGVGVLDGRMFQIPLADAKRLLRAGGGTQMMIVMLRDYRDAAAVAARIEGLLRDPAVAVTPWTAIGDYPRLMEGTTRIYSFMFLVILFLGAFIITNIMMMVVMERRREIGILKSMGFSRREILALFLWEGAFLGTLGSLIGAALGLGIVTLLHFHGLDFSAAMRGLSLPLDNVIYPTVDVPATIGIVVLGAAIAALVSVLPSLRAARMNVVEAIKSV